MDSTPKQLKSLSKFMSLILRHKPEDFGVVLDPEGWTGIDELLEAMNRERPVTRAQLEDVVQQVEPDKQRFSIEGEEIRANYGHSLAGKITHEAAAPPELLFHGTNTRVLETILEGGLEPMSRQYVHLTPNGELASRVGGRRGKPVLVTVEAGRAHAAGVVFYRANHAFWLTDRVPAEFLRR